MKTANCCNEKNAFGLSPNPLRQDVIRVHTYISDVMMQEHCVEEYSEEY